MPQLSTQAVSLASTTANLLVNEVLDSHSGSPGSTVASTFVTNIMSYDLFISYFRRDNVDQGVAELVERIATDYLQVQRRTTLVFLRQARIHGMEEMAA